MCSKVNDIYLNESKNKILIRFWWIKIVILRDNNQCRKNIYIFLFCISDLQTIKLNIYYNNHRKIQAKKNEYVSMVVGIYNILHQLFKSINFFKMINSKNILYWWKVLFIRSTYWRR